MLVDLKLPKTKKSDSKAMPSPEMADNQYPYGMTITIEGDTLKKFPDLMNVQAGQEVNIEAIARVKMVRKIDTSSANSYEKSSVELQLMKLDVSMEKDLDTAFNEDD